MDEYLVCYIKDFIRPRLPENLVFELMVTRMMRRARQRRVKWFADHTGGTMVVHEGMFGVKCEDEDGTFVFHVR